MVDEAIKSCKIVDIELAMHALQDTCGYKGKGHSVKLGKESNSPYYWTTNDMEEWNRDERCHQVGLSGKVNYLSPNFIDVAHKRATETTNKYLKVWDDAKCSGKISMCPCGKY